MILLDGHSLTPAKKVRAEAMSLQLKERDATASMTPASADGITVNSWLKDDTNPGAGIVWRVKSVNQAFSSDAVTVSLEHAINTLRDTILFGKVTPAMMAGRLGATTCTAQEAINYILNQQSDWVLYSFDYASVENPYKFDGETLFEAIQTVSDSLTDAWWSYDMSVYPFRLNITTKQSGVDSILRPGRNLRTISKTIDKSQMFTRFYPIGADDLHIDSNYVDKNTNLYGVVSKVETDNSISTKAELTRWANERLAKHAEPTVTIDIEGLELADATGENMDRLTLGRICAVYLPEFGTTIQERITALSYSDKIGQPETVKITLANTQTDIMKVLADNIKKSGRSSRSSVKRDKEDLAWFEDTNDHVAMVAKGIVGVDAQGNPNWIRLSQIVVSGTGIDQTVQSIQEDQVIAEGRISITETKVGMTVKSNDARPTKVYATYADLPAEGSASYKYFVEATGKYYKWENNAYTEFNPNGIAAGEICVAINNSGESEAVIDASKIYLLGQVIANTITADYIDSKIATLATLHGVGASFTGNMSVSGAVYGSGIYVGTQAPYVDISNPVNSVTITGPSSGVYTLTVTKADGTSSTYTFNRAASSLSGSWSSGSFPLTVTDGVNNYVIDFIDTSSPGNANIKLFLDTGTTSQNASNKKQLDVPLYVKSYASGTPPTITTRYSETVTVDATDVYTSGWSDCYDTLDTSGTSATGTLSYGGSAVVSVKQKNSSGTVVTRLTRTYTAPADRYNTGYSDGQSAAWINYVPGPPYSKTAQGTIAAGRWVYPGTSGNMWWTAAPWFGYTDTKGSNHQGMLGGHKYIRLVTLDYNGAVSDPLYDNATWEIPSGSSDTYTKYTFSKTRTQSSDGYHYTFSIGTGWQTPFGADGGTYDLYKKN